MKRNLYLNIKEKEAARQEYLDAFAEVRPSAEKIAVSESLGRMTAEAVYAVCSSPAYNSCAMDGIAVTVNSGLTTGCICRHWLFTCFCRSCGS